MDTIPTCYIVLLGIRNRYVTCGNNLKQFMVLHNQMLRTYLKKYSRNEGSEHCQTSHLVTKAEFNLPIRSPSVSQLQSAHASELKQ